MVKRTYNTMINVFEKTKKDKLNASDFRRYFKANGGMADHSVYETLSRAVKDGVLYRDEYGFYFIVDKDN